MWQGEYFRSPPEIIGVVFAAYTFFYAIEKVVLYRQLTKPKVVSFTRPALLKHFKVTANHAGHIWSQQALVPSFSVPSLQDWGWMDISKRRVATLLHTTVRNYWRYNQPSTLVRRAMPRTVTIGKGNPQLFFSITSSCLHEVLSH